ncbi:MAG: RICIN domain-containing protein [Atopobiaceae bacterium]|nr:RICIN domain-containing protein [Atopobiaceae bacterium]
MAITAGLYEIRSMLLTSMTIDVAGGKAVNGANVQIYASNDTNAQKFLITEETAGHWSMANANSGLYVDVAGGAASNGVNVQQWTSNGSRAQRWKLTETGETVTVNGVTCTVVTIGSYVTNDGATYVMDVNGAMTTNSTNVQIYTANGSDAQEFVLVPTTLLDTSMPVPMGIGWSEAVGEQGQLSLPEATKLYPCWQFTDAWGALAGHGFETSTRTRTIANDSATPTDWSSWSAWTAATVTVDGSTAWLAGGISATVPSGSKALEVGIRVRPTGTVGGSSVHGSASSAVLTALDVPTVSLSSAKLAADHVALAVTSDYGGGSTTLRVTSLVGSDGTEYLARPVDASGTSSPVVVEVPMLALADVPNPATVTTMAATVEYGTDQCATCGTATLSASFGWASGRSLSCSPSLDWTLVDACACPTFSTGSVRRGWFFVDGEAYEMDAVAATKLLLPYPFGRAVSWYVSGVNAAGTAYGAYVGSIAADDAHRHKPCHAWTWGGRSLLLEIVAGRMVTSRTVKANADALDLDQRPWQVVTFSETLQGDLKASGVLLDGSKWSTADLLALMRAHHALYRAPGGEVAYVGVTDVQYETGATYTDVDISMTQEAR